MVSPILCFGSEVWGYEYSSVIESVHYDFCKNFLGVNSSVNNVVALGECGRLPLCVTYITNCIKYWCRLLRMEDHRCPKNCYKMLLSHLMKQKGKIGCRKFANFFFNMVLGTCGLPRSLAMKSYS